MKQIIIVLIAVVAFTACKKERQNVYPEPAPATPVPVQHAIITPDQPINNIKTIPDYDYSSILGRYAYAHDKDRWFIITTIENGEATVYFPASLNTPKPEPIAVKYTVQHKGDVIDIKVPNIYPCIRFNGPANGEAVEYLKGPQQGEYLPIVKL